MKNGLTITSLLLAVDATKIEASTGGDAELKKIAESKLPILQQHLKHAEQMLPEKLSTQG